jgi:site-specific DNA-methyltransferase (adenine-specific)
VGTDENLARPYGGENKIYGDFAMQRGTITGEGLTGRWPANLIHDGSDEVTELFPQSNSNATPRNRSPKQNREQWRMGGAEYNATVEYGDSGSAARFFYVPKCNKKDREDGNTHPTVKPTDLMAYLCRLVTPPEGIILDPFMGSGSTGKAAVREGFDFIGIEREEEYVAIASKRLQVIQRSILASRSADQNG